MFEFGDSASGCALQGAAYFPCTLALYLQIDHSGSIENGDIISSKKMNPQPLLRNIYLLLKWCWFGFAVIISR